MRIKFSFITICAVIMLSLFFGEANAEIKRSIIDSVCCKPDSLKIVSTNYPVFCISWKISTDSACQRPYGFEIEWKLLGALTWNNRTVMYSGGILITFCDSVTTCGPFQWRVRTICDTIGGATYSDWVYGNKFAMTNCFEDSQKSNDPKDKRNSKSSKLSLAVQPFKNEED